MASEAHEAQLMNTHSVLMNLSEDGLLKPFRQMSGMAAPGEDLGGWYNYNPAYDYRAGFDEGFAPDAPSANGCLPWPASTPSPGRGDAPEVLRLNRLYAQTITADFYIKNRFPAYTYDKLLLGSSTRTPTSRTRGPWPFWSRPPTSRCRSSGHAIEPASAGAWTGSQRRLMDLGRVLHPL